MQSLELVKCLDLHEAEFLVNGEERAFCELFRVGHWRLADQDLTLDLGKRYERLRRNGRRKGNAKS